MYLYNNEKERYQLGINAKKFSENNLLSWDERCEMETKILENICKTG